MNISDPYSISEVYLCSLTFQAFMCRSISEHTTKVMRILINLQSIWLRIMLLYRLQFKQMYNVFCFMHTVSLKSRIDLILGYNYNKFFRLGKNNGFFIPVVHK